MLHRPMLVAQTSSAKNSAAQAPSAIESGNLLPAATLRDFAVTANIALLAALSDRGDDVSGLALQRRLRAYAIPQSATATKVRRYA